MLVSKNNYLASLQNIQTDEVLRIRKFPAKFIERAGALAYYNPDVHGPFSRGVEFVRQYSKTVVKDCNLAQGLWVNNLKVSNLLLNDSDMIRVNQVGFLYQENALFLAKEEDSVVAKQTVDRANTQGKKVAINLLLVCGVFVMTSFLTLIVCLMVQEHFFSQKMIAEADAERLDMSEKKQKNPAFFVPEAKNLSKPFPTHILPTEVKPNSAASDQAQLTATPIEVTAQQATDPFMVAESPTRANQESTQQENTQASIDSENISIDSEEASVSASTSDSPFAAAQEPPKSSEALLFSPNVQTAQKKNGHAELSQELEEGHPQAAKKLVREFDQRYLSGSGKSVLKEAKIFLAEPSVAESEKSVLRNKLETFGDLVGLYEKGNRLYSSGNKDGAFKSWLDFLKAEKNIFGDEKSQYAREVTSYAVKALLDRAMKLQAQQQQIEAFQLREAAAKIEIDAQGPAHQWVEQTLRKAQEQIKLAEQVESSNIEQAKKHWQNVLDMLPREHSIAEQAHSKLSWYQYQNP